MLWPGLSNSPALKKDLDEPLLTLVATNSSADADKSLDQILRSASVYEDRAFQMVAAVDVKRAALGKQLHEPNNRVEPAPASGDDASPSRENRGQFENMIRDLRELDEACGAADLVSWQTIHDRLGHKSVGQPVQQPTAETTPTNKTRGPAVTGADEGNLAEKIANLTQKLYSLQQLAYNLWALREIHAADEDTDNWDVPLARIDTGLLHPTVAALYQQTYGEKIKTIDDPLTTIAKAQHMLSSPKTGLSAF